MRHWFYHFARDLSKLCLKVACSIIKTRHSHKKDYLCTVNKDYMAQIDDFFMYENRVEDITDADYQRAQPYVEAAQAFAQTTYQSIYIIDYHRKNFLYVSDNPLFLCGHTAEEVREMGYDFYLSYVPKEEVPMLTELNRSGFRAFYDEPVENRRQCMMSYDFHIAHGKRNEPAYIPYIIERLADVYATTPEHVAAVTTENAERLFF